MSGRIKIRKACAKDAAAVAALTRYVDCPWSERQAADEIALANALFYIAEHDGKPVAFLSGVCAADECEIGDIAVDVNYRRRGVATTLFNRLIADASARGTKSFFLLVRTDNAPAIGLYEKIGFAAVGVRSGYYGVGDAAVMRLDR